MSDSYVQVGNKGVTTFSGPDAMALAHAITLRGAIKLYAAHRIIPTRGVTISMMLMAASRITKKAYKRGAYAAAQSDLTVWIEAMKAAMPIINDKDKSQ